MHFFVLSCSLSLCTASIYDFCIFPELLVLYFLFWRFILLAFKITFYFNYNVPGIGEIQFHVALSAGITPVGPKYRAASVKEKYKEHCTWLTARREGVHGNLDGQTILDNAYNEVSWHFSLLEPNWDTSWCPWVKYSSLSILTMILTSNFLEANELLYFIRWKLNISSIHPYNKLLNPILSQVL